MNTIRKFVLGSLYYDPINPFRRGVGVPPEIPNLFRFCKVTDKGFNFILTHNHKNAFNKNIYCEEAKTTRGKSVPMLQETFTFNLKNEIMLRLQPWKCKPSNTIDLSHLTIPNGFSFARYGIPEDGEPYLTSNGCVEFNSNEMLIYNSRPTVVLKKLHRQPKIVYVNYAGYWESGAHSSCTVLHRVAPETKFQYHSQEYDMILVRGSGDMEYLALGYWNDGLEVD